MTNETQVMPAVALRGITILPDMIVHFDVSRKKSIRAIEEAMTKDQRPENLFDHPERSESGRTFRR